MTDANETVLAALAEAFPGKDFAPGSMLPGEAVAQAQMCVRVAPADLLDVMRMLRTDERCLFEQLADLTCVDYLNFPGATDRYGVTYNLVSVSLGHRFWLKCFVNDPEPTVPSVTGVWRGANWLEREVWDLFGVRFEGHPDLRRLLTWEGFEAHPLRKDYPLQGRGEREDFTIATRDIS